MVSFSTYSNLNSYIWWLSELYLVFHLFWYFYSFSYCVVIIFLYYFMSLEYYCSTFYYFIYWFCFLSIKTDILAWSTFSLNKIAFNAFYFTSANVRTPNDKMKLSIYSFIVCNYRWRYRIARLDYLSLIYIYVNVFNKSYVFAL